MASLRKPEWLVEGLFFQVTTSTGFKRADGHRCGVRLQTSSAQNKSFYNGLNVDGGIKPSTTLLEPKRWQYEHRVYRRRGDGVLRRSGSKVNDLVIAFIHQF